MQPVCLHGYVSGRVQGVWFRGFVRNQARQQQLSGWAKNLDDGRVELVIQGDEEEVDEFIEDMHDSPISHHIQEQEQHNVPLLEGVKGFSIA